MNNSIVFDTNTLVSASLFENSIPKKCLNKALIEYKIVSSDACFAELVDILNRPKFSKYLSFVEAANFVSFYKFKV